MSNTKEDVIERLCLLVGKVGVQHFNYRAAHDCFCHKADPKWEDFRCDDGVLDFIEKAVEDKLKGVKLMEDLFERKEDCPPVESIIWDKVAISYGNFEGIHQLSEFDLLQLKVCIDYQLREYNNED